MTNTSGDSPASASIQNPVLESLVLALNQAIWSQSGERMRANWCRLPDLDSLRCKYIPSGPVVHTILMTVGYIEIAAIWKRAWVPGPGQNRTQHKLFAFQLVGNTIKSMMLKDKIADFDLSVPGADPVRHMLKQLQAGCESTQAQITQQHRTRSQCQHVGSANTRKL